MLGGFLVSHGLVHGQTARALAQTVSPLIDGQAPSAYLLSLAAVLLTYVSAGLLNVGVPDSGARYPRGRRDLAGLWTEFWQAHRTLWRDREGGLSLAVTTLFWGVGATLQFAVLRWAADVLRLPLDPAAYLQAAVAVGVVAGAGLAGRVVPLAAARRVLPLGVFLGLMVALVAFMDQLVGAVLMLGLAGFFGGLLVVPLNALLQHRGCTLLSAGRSIAVQGFNENASVLAMLAIYGALLAPDVPIVPLLYDFGLLIAAAMAALWWSERSRPAPPGR